MEARKLNPTQETIERSIIKLLSEVDRAIIIDQAEIDELEKTLSERRDHLLFLQGQSDAFTRALKEIREEIPEADQ